jgi:MFS family permease
MASGLFGMGIILGPTLGPTVGGWILDSAEWPLIFTVNIPIGIIATILAFLFVERREGEGEKKKAMTIDYTGIALLAVGIGSLQYVLERGEAEDWFASNNVRVLAVTATIGLIGFIWRWSICGYWAIERLRSPRSLLSWWASGCLPRFLFTPFLFSVLWAGHRSKRACPCCRRRR